MRQRLDFYKKPGQMVPAGPVRSVERGCNFTQRNRPGPPEADFPLLRPKIVSFRPKQRQNFVQADGVVTYRILLEK